jgi:transcriptional regulator with GAF, ATPase, and Fis domain
MNADLPQVLSLLASQLRLGQLLPMALDITIAMTGADRAFLMLYDQHGDLGIRAARNSHKADLPAADFQGSTSVVGKVVEQKKALCLTDLSTHPEFSPAQSVRAMKLQSAICLPLWMTPPEGGVSGLLGILYLDSLVSGSPLQEEHLQLMQALANHLSISIENAHLFGEVERQKDEIAQLNVRLQQKVERQAGNLSEMRIILAETQRELAKVYGLGNIIGGSKPMRKVYQILERVVRTDATVLILGESGTGKELVARYIHYNGPRAEKPMLCVNCSAFNESLLESELFGHRKGAFTGAMDNKMGLFELAHEGTLFLDEVGNMSLEMQKKLLRVLEDGEVRPVGGRESFRVNVRIIAATNVDLKELVAREKFRDDFYFRLNVLTIQIPPLRERREDIPLLVDYFSQKISSELQRSLRPPPEEIMQWFMEYDWPGNVRELENELRRVFILESDYEHPGASGREEDLSLISAEKRAILKALEAANGNKSRAAEILGMPRSTFYLKLARYRIF